MIGVLTGAFCGTSAGTLELVPVRFRRTIYVVVHYQRYRFILGRGRGCGHSESTSAHGAGDLPSALARANSSSTNLLHTRSVIGPTGTCRLISRASSKFSSAQLRAHGEMLSPALRSLSSCFLRTPSKMRSAILRLSFKLYQPVDRLPLLWSELIRIVINSTQNGQNLGSGFRNERQFCCHDRSSLPPAYLAYLQSRSFLFSRDPGPILGISEEVNRMLLLRSILWLFEPPNSKDKPGVACWTAREADITVHSQFSSFVVVRIFHTFSQGIARWLGTGAHHPSCHQCVLAYFSEEKFLC